MKTYSNRAKGIVTSIEIMLILSAVIAIAFIANLGLGKIVMNQAMSTKAMVTIQEPQGWYYGVDNEINHNPTITVSLSITNMGNKDITIDNVYIMITPGCTYNAGGVGITVHAGETIIQSIRTTKHCNSNSNIPVHADLFLQYSTRDGRTNVIQHPIILTHA